MDKLAAWVPGRNRYHVQTTSYLYLVAQQTIQQPEKKGEGELHLIDLHKTNVLIWYVAMIKRHTLDNGVTNLGGNSPAISKLLFSKTLFH